MFICMMDRSLHIRIFAASAVPRLERLLRTLRTRHPRRQRQPRDVHPTASVARNRRRPIDVTVIAVRERERQFAPVLGVDVRLIEIWWKARATADRLRSAKRGVVAGDRAKPDDP